MRITYDPVADAAYIYLTERPAGVEGKQTVVDTFVENSAVIAEFNEASQLVGIEVLGASRGLPPEVLARAHRA
jgi:uncharacterized protein YuzE